MAEQVQEQEAKEAGREITRQMVTEDQGAKLGRVEITDGVNTWLCRVPTVEDMWAILEGMPLLPGLRESLRALALGREVKPAEVAKRLEAFLKRGTEEEQMLARMKMQRANVQTADALLARCSIRPKLVHEVLETYPDGQEGLAEYNPVFRLRAFQELMQEAGWQPATAAPDEEGNMVPPDPEGGVNPS